MRTILQPVAGTLAVAALLLPAQPGAESTVGRQTVGSAQASARVNLRIGVPSLIALRVGTPGVTIDTVDFTVTATGVAADGNSQQPAAGPNQPYTNGPLDMNASSINNTVQVTAWTNRNSSSLTCRASGNGGATIEILGTGTNVPILSEIHVSNAGAGVALAHPGTSLNDCTGNGAGGGTTPLTNNTLYNDQWTYTLVATLSNYQYGSYGTQVIYTAATP